MSKLNRITNMADLARRAKYHVEPLADSCGVTRQHLNRYIQAEFGVAAQAWIAALWLQDVFSRLQGGELSKQIFAEFGCASQAGFSRRVKQLSGATPSALKSQVAVQVQSQRDCIIQPKAGPTQGGLALGTRPYAPQP